MGEQHTPQPPKKFHGDKLAEALQNDPADRIDVSRLPRHPAGKSPARATDVDDTAGAAGRS